MASNRGRPARLTIDTVVQAGLAVAAADGLDALTMRRVAKQIGVGAMSLYTYVPGRAELIDLMIDRAYAELSLPTPDMDFRPAFTQWARASDGTATGMNSEQYRQSMSGFWEDYFDAERYPIMTQVWLAGGFETVEITLEQTVDRLLAVIDMTIERGRRGPSSP